VRDDVSNDGMQSEMDTWGMGNEKAPPASGVWCATKNFIFSVLSAPSFTVLSSLPCFSHCILSLKITTCRFAKVHFFLFIASPVLLISYTTRALTISEVYATAKYPMPISPAGQRVTGLEDPFPMNRTL